MIYQDKTILKHYLHPSTLFISKEQCKVLTVLGSCISICLYDKHLKIGGINHFMMPLWNGEGLATPKYGNIAIEKLIESMKDLGARKETMIAKVFGGANQIGSVANVGGRNTQVAFEYLKKEGIKVVAKNVGGPVGKKISFDTSTGEVILKYVKKSEK